MEPRVALAHDYLLVLRGAERTFAAMADLAPEAPIFTLFYDPDGTQHRFDGHRVVTSPLARAGIHQGNFRRLLPLLPLAASRLSTRGHGLVLSSSSAFAHGVSIDADAVHVCYCHTPFRYAWFEQERAMAEVPAVARPLLRLALSGIRSRDRRIASSVTRYVANSELCRERIQRFWGRDADVVHPPVELDRFLPGEPADRFLVVTELVRHKRVDLALSAADRAGRRVVVVGEGPDGARLRSQFGERHEFLGRVSDDRLAGLYASALALIVPNVEEFGIAAVEAQAAGRPVVGADAGGLRETVIPGETGELLPEGDIDALAEALRNIDFSRYDSGAIRGNAERFSVAAFQERMREQIAVAQA